MSDQLQANVDAALAEPSRFARLDGSMYYDCELGMRFRVAEALLLRTWRANRHMNNSRTAVVDEIPAAATAFEVGDELSGEAVELDLALDTWALWCDDRAKQRPQLRAV